MNYVADKAWEIFPERMLFAQKQASHNYGNTTTNYFWYEIKNKIDVISKVIILFLLWQK